MRRSTYNYLCHALAGSPDKWRPLLAVYYLTYACDFRCPKCCDGSGTPYYRLGSPVLSGPDVMRLLSTVRRHSDYLVITGGEPLKHPGLAYVLSHIGGLRFDGVVFTTNGYGVGPHLPAIVSSVQHLVFSIDTLDPEKADRWFGMGPGILSNILREIERAREMAAGRCEIIISSVAMPDNLDDLNAVYDYARERGFRFALCPVLEGVKAPAAFNGNDAYRRLFDRLIADKKGVANIHGSVQYLEHMRDLKKFSCRPSTVLAISPAGDVFYPCLEQGNVAGNLLETPDLHEIRAEGRRRFGPEPSCDTRCHSACALGLSLALNHPLSSANEGWLMLRREVGKRLGVERS